MTFDGVNFENRTFSDMVKVVFYYYEEMMEHSREVRHWEDVIGDWGGLHSIVFTIFASFVLFFNDYLK